jgi:hypothetical protein
VRTKLLIGILLFLLLFATRGYGQGPGRPSPPPSRVEGDAPVVEGDENQERVAHDMAKKANLDRQAALKSDTDKLFKLATELKDSVDKSNENVLSLEVLKKAEEIEKLAHSVKDKMKGQN